MSDPKTDPADPDRAGAPPPEAAAPPGVEAPDPVAAARALADRVAELDAALAAEKEAHAAFKDGALRQLAEARNLQARAERDAAEARRYGAVPLARDLLAVADNIARALAALPEAEAGQAADARLATLRQGVALIERELAAVLERHGVKRFEPAGEKLDPNRHQAMFEVESDAAPGTVVQVVQAGYTLHDRLLRPALVGVARAKPRPPAPVDPK